MDEIIIRESKSYLENVNNGISKTRDKAWQLLAFVMAVNVYLGKSVIEETKTDMMQYLFPICFLFSMFIFYKLYKTLLPSGIVVNGFEPIKLEQINKDGKQFFYDSLKHSLQIAIDSNQSILSNMIMSYKLAVKAVIIMVSIFMFLVFYSYLLSC
jgi:hypothetical protein